MVGMSRVRAQCHKRPAVSITKSPRVAEQCDVNIHSLGDGPRNFKPWSSDEDDACPDGHGYELVSSVQALVPQKFSVEEELMHVKHVEVKSPHVGVMWKFGRGVISSGIVLVT
ncbi:hypothetical protein TNCV_1416861 [Trichonephila clavipes]|nr:hypothetical protein TNCV_1416861 [Trichonephila clavipes]